jgi:K+-sensing histidine kinase KdpD
MRHRMAFLDKLAETLQNSSTLIGNVRKLRDLYLGRYKPETIDPGLLLADVRQEYKIVPGRDVTIRMTAAKGSTVSANALLEDVFTNLVGNAIRNSTGPVAVQMALDKALVAEKAYYRITIEDDGPGIPDWKKWQIFERLKQGQTSGKGFGLYLMKTLVDHFHGLVWVEDRVPGNAANGSRFVVLLPAA